MKTEWMSREQIDEVLNNLSAADLIEAVDEASDTRKATGAFNAAATRMGIEQALTRVRANDFKYLASRMNEVVNIDSPLSAETSESLASVNTGE